MIDSSLEYFNGLDIYIYRPQLEGFPYGVLFQINPVTTQYITNQETCFQNNGTSDGPTTIQSIFPDLSLFTVC